MLMLFWTFKLSFDEDNLAIWGLFWLLFPKFGRICVQPSGHPDFKALDVCE
jgi:hypothetical protein